MLYLKHFEQDHYEIQHKNQSHRTLEILDLYIFNISIELYHMYEMVLLYVQQELLHSVKVQIVHMQHVVQNS